MASASRREYVEVKLDFNGKSSWSGIEKEMVRLFDEVGLNYNKRTNHSISVIKGALKAANQVIYKEAQVRAPVIKPHIQATKQTSRKNIHLGSPEYMIERSAHGKKWVQQGIIARRFITFKKPVSEYAAAIEYGRDAFLQVVRKKPFGIQGGDTSFWVRQVGAMKAQPFLRESQQAKAQEAVNTFSTVLERRWLRVLTRLEKRRGK
ncbi:hypothetical protein F2P58_23435 [Vibrio fortis]|uniref:Uncharacterized protein n=1 Tax=Vibrio fortis TaxID=212667 RepID=A0A5N3QTH0_9VIBR|nr:hypothetical protein [Vibrio fortis]KAB0285468.1 hypothetical protein F2P58_23435 [Vibrio fortis]